MQLCRHQNHKIIDWIKDPKWSTKEILINTEVITPDVEHYIIQFANPSPQREYGWFYMSGKTIRRHKVQPNGRGTVYVVPLSKREPFTPIKQCEHTI